MDGVPSSIVEFATHIKIGHLAYSILTTWQMYCISYLFYTQTIWAGCAQQAVNTVGVGSK